MLLQPDSELYIIPSEGGEARRLRCNTHLMNSWHSWSPNSRWLVFSSKANSDYTQLFLTHIDDAGQSTPPIQLSHLTDPDRAANIPEFVNVPATAITKIHEQFLNDSSYVRSGNEFYRAREYDSAIDKYRAALKLNPNNLEAHLRLTMVCACQQRYEEAKIHHARAKALCASDPLVAYYVGLWLMGEKRYGEVVFCLSLALNEAPHSLIEKPLLVDMHHKLGLALCYQNMFDQSVAQLSEAVRLDPDNGELYYSLALALACQGKEGALAEARKQYDKAISLQPDIDRSATLHRTLAMRHAQAGQFADAVSAETRALDLARAGGNPESVAEIRRELELYRQGKRLPPTEKTPDVPSPIGSAEK
jgi:tetratricopeptide (TPR) repeat protein